ncbi:MAG: dockerin type I repeat-containing protein [Oscillospiraceae bacterium]|nr:dockerin type I repeat-containing protein [Oscillospiraceae bacterium]
MKHPGDANLDCEVDILDVIAANKNILGIGILDNTGLKNADMDGNGTVDSADSLAILKAALDIHPQSNLKCPYLWQERYGHDCAISYTRL